MERAEEVYWITGGSCLPSPNNFGSLIAGLVAELDHHHIHLNWMEEIQWLIDVNLDTQKEDSLFGDMAHEMAIFTWASHPIADHYHFQAACRTILCGERQAIVIGNVTSHAMDFLLLASPGFVGRYNLLPRAQVRGNYVIPGGKDSPWDEVLQMLENERIGPDDMSCFYLLSANKKITDTCLNGFPQAEILVTDSGYGGSFTLKVNEIISSLIEKEQRFGLVLSQASRSPIVLSLVERI